MCIRAIAISIVHQPSSIYYSDSQQAQLIATMLKVDTLIFKYITIAIQIYAIFCTIAMIKSLYTVLILVL